METNVKETSGKLPLVSVVVITYNSSKYVIETLESIKNQTYQNIELVISDDCSTDETVAICREWVEKNQQRFLRSKIVEIQSNTGVAPNCNRGLNAAHGEWVKLIAGDDVIFSDGIEAFVDFISKKEHIEVVVSSWKYFGEKSGRFSVSEKVNKLPIELQLKRALLRVRDGQPGLGCSGFYKKETLASIGGYDETFPLIEDYPTTIKILCSNIKIYYLDVACVGYRINNGSISTDECFSEKFSQMYEKCAIHVIKERKYYGILYHFYAMKASHKYGGLGCLNKFLRHFLKATSFYFWVCRFRLFLKFGPDLNK